VARACRPKALSTVPSVAALVVVEATTSRRARQLNWSDGTLRIVPLKKSATLAAIKLGNFHPDNVHFLPDGNLLVAGQVGDTRDIMGCIAQPTCLVGSMIVVVDLNRRMVLSEREVAPTSTFGAAATALQDGKVFWLSSFRGDRIMRIDPIPGSSESH
jgi:hypothetical protein